MTEKWITEKLLDFITKSIQYQEILVDEKSDFQHIQVIRTNYFGKILLLDGVIQLTELDNAAYHEMIVHIPMLVKDNPEKILIVGGGDGGALQQVLKYHSVKHITVCEIDERVVELCSEHFPNFGNPFNDNKVQLIIQDAFEYLKTEEDNFDVIIADTTDPNNEAEKLFTEEFYRLMVNALISDKGVISAQCENLYFNSELIIKMMSIAKNLVQNPAYYHTLVPTYPGGGIGFMYISNIHWKISLDKPYPGNMDYLNREIHEAAFALPEFIRRKL
ncbi:polyamine aminopropyltransferase [Chloroflexota bacterium]